MAEFNEQGSEVNARIVYWGPPGCGKTTNLQQIHAKLRPDHRGELELVPTRLDPTVHYEVLPIELGELGGVRTRLQVAAVPSAHEQLPTRKQLLDGVDGVVFVIDSRRDRIEDNLTSFAELRRCLASYGRTIDDVPLVLQYNKRDLTDPYVLEELHRKLEARGAAAFEAVAHEGTAVLPTLTTISKRVVRSLREQAAEPRVPANPQPRVAAPPPGVSQIIDQAAAPPPATPAGSAADPDPAEVTNPMLRTPPAPPPIPEPAAPAPHETPVMPAIADPGAAPEAMAEAKLEPVRDPQGELETESGDDLLQAAPLDDPLLATPPPLDDPLLATPPPLDGPLLDTPPPLDEPSPDAAPVPATSPNSPGISQTSILSASYHPEADAAETTARARALLDQSFEEASAIAEKEESADEALSIASVGAARASGPRRIELPVVLQSVTGRRFPVKLSIQIEPDPEADD